MIADFAMAPEASVMATVNGKHLELAIYEYAPVLYRITYSVLRNSADAEDAVQETFLQALRFGNKIALVEDQKAWLARIAWRHALQRRRKKVSVREVACSFAPR